MIGRCLALAGIFVAAGLLTYGRPGLTGYVKPDETWLEQATPSKVDGMSFIASAENPAQSYKMDAATYESLQPFGIVSRVFVGPQGQRFDAVVIAGDNADSFHDQRACFVAQNWEILEDKEIELDVAGIGKVSAVELELKGPGGPAVAIYTFRGPSGRIYSRFNDMWKDFFTAELTSGRIQAGIFYRFISSEATSDREPLRRFAASFISQASPMFDQAVKARQSR